MADTVLHAIEKKIIASLLSDSDQTFEDLVASAHLSPDQARRGIEWLRHKKIVHVHETEEHEILLDKYGKNLPDNLLPERRLLHMIKNDPPPSMQDVQAALGPSAGAALGVVKKNGWVQVMPAKPGGAITLRATDLEPPDLLPGEDTLQKLVARSGRIKLGSDTDIDETDLDALIGRPHLVKKMTYTTRHVTLDQKKAESLAAKLGNTHTTGARDSSGSDGSYDNDDKKQRHGRVDDGAGGRNYEKGAIDVKAAVPGAMIGRTHPLKDVISEIKEIFAMMGFAEVSGSIIQPCFWNFDALLTPQDHPSREMQDTFYLNDALSYKGADALQGHLRHISKTHTQTWHQKWDPSEAKRAVLRTHTTCVTLRHLQKLAASSSSAPGYGGDARMFSLGRVFRNEKTSYKHLAEFTQVEGVVHEKGAGIRDLMGIQTEFYRRLGLPKVKFWPTFFPYTEPSFQSMVYNERVGKWVELFGMGVFRPDVTRGLEHPVLAWGGGVERIAMIKYGVDDVREFYANNMNWLRSAKPTCR